MVICIMWTFARILPLLTEPRYPYPIFELLDTKGRIGLFAVSALLMTANTLTLKHLYGRVNGFGRSERSEARPGDVKKGDYHRK